MGTLDEVPGLEPGWLPGQGSLRSTQGKLTLDPRISASFFSRRPPYTNCWDPVLGAPPTIFERPDGDAKEGSGPDHA